MRAPDGRPVHHLTDRDAKIFRDIMTKETDLVQRLHLRHALVPEDAESRTMDLVLSKLWREPIPPELNHNERQN